MNYIVIFPRDFAILRGIVLETYNLITIDENDRSCGNPYYS